MSVDTDILLYNLINTLHTTLAINVCKNTKKFLTGKISKKYGTLSQEDKFYYVAYGVKLAQSLTGYIPKITLLEINTGDNPDISYNFKLQSKECGSKYISLSHEDILIRDIIPEKLMKICKYRKNTNVHKEYTAEYQKICEKVYAKINSNEKYSDMDEAQKQKKIYKHYTELVTETLKKKRKCASNLYAHLFSETDRIVLKLYKKRFIIYDFGIELKESEIKSFKITKKSDSEINIQFNNGTIFCLTLHTNSTLVKEHLSLKFHTKFENMDELFVVRSSPV